MSDRRAMFFAGAALACFLLVPVAESSLRWVPWTVGITYVVLSIASWLDFRSRRRGDS